MTKMEGTTISIFGDEYQIILNLGDLLVLKRNGFFILYFEKQKTMLQCDKKEKFTRAIVDVNTSTMTFYGIEFKKNGYENGECETRNIKSLINGMPVTFNVDKNNKLLKVTD